jgi:ATP-dependent DNA ligase
MNATLYKMDNNGAIREWFICSTIQGLIIEHGLLDGDKITTTESITEGKGGRDTNDQIEHRVSSRINKQIDRGYQHSIALASKQSGMNGMGTTAPMLAQRYDKIDLKSAKIAKGLENARVQRKLDGNRMLVTKTDGKVIGYTRNGKVITTLDHILKDLDFLPEGWTIDGEVYIHGMDLKDINSRIRKLQPGTAELEYHVYDMVSHFSFYMRHRTLEMMHFINSTVLEPTWTYNEHTLALEFDEARREGYEGLMLRLSGHGYAAGKRDISLLKIKHRYDDEFTVSDVITDKVGNGILVFNLPNGKSFKAVAPGNHDEKQHALTFKDEYIGREVTVSYAYLTAFGIPFHAVCERYRVEI